MPIPWRRVLADGAEGDGDGEPDNRPALEDELLGGRTQLDLFAPRPLRLALAGAAAIGCLIALLFSAASISRDVGSGDAAFNAVQLRENVINTAVNAGGLAGFLAFFRWDNRRATARVSARRELRAAQVRLGDRCAPVAGSVRLIVRAWPLIKSYRLRPWQDRPLISVAPVQAQAWRLIRRTDRTDRTDPRSYRLRIFESCGWRVPVTDVVRQGCAIDAAHSWRSRGL